MFKRSTRAVRGGGGAMTAGSEARTAGHPWSPLTWMRWCYDWVCSLAERKHGSRALFWVAFAESSFFPIPPDVLLIALGVSAPKRSLRFAAVCTLGSVLGAALGYLLGWQFYEWVGDRIVRFYAAEDAYQQVQQMYEQYNAVAVGVAGLTILPFKLFTIAAGAFQVNFPVFMLAAAVSRAARFFAVGGLIWWVGPKVQPLIERYFEWLAVLFMLLLAAGFFLVQYLL